jgi:nucleotide-binding universal stress UspA family protein
MLLTDEFLEGTWAHTRSERRRTVCAHKIDFLLFVKKIGHEKKYGAQPPFASHFDLNRRRIYSRQRIGWLLTSITNMKRILVPIDFSDATLRVIDLAQQLAKALDAEIHLVHVKELAAAAAPGTLGYGLAGMPELAPMSGVPLPVFDPMPQTVPVDEDEQSKLTHWQDKIAQSGVKVTLHEPTGAVVEEILNEADVVNADLIVMGTHGHGAMYNLLVGGVTKGVLKRSTHPVLLVPGPRR